MKAFGYVSEIFVHEKCERFFKRGVGATEIGFWIIFKL